MTNTVWVLTYEVNLYDQQGEYFEAVWKEKPTKEQVCNYLGYIGDLKQNPYLMEYVDHILSGGGRRKDEDHWYILKEENYQC